MDSRSFAMFEMTQAYAADIAKAVKPDASGFDEANVMELLNGFAEIVRGNYRNDIVKLIANSERPYEKLRESWKMKVAVDEHGCLIPEAPVDIVTAP